MTALLKVADGSYTFTADGLPSLGTPASEIPPDHELNAFINP